MKRALWSLSVLALCALGCGPESNAPPPVAVESTVLELLGEGRVIAHLELSGADPMSSQLPVQLEALGVVEGDQPSRVSARLLDSEGHVLASWLLSGGPERVEALVHAWMMEPSAVPGGHGPRAAALPDADDGPFCLRCSFQSDGSMKCKQITCPKAVNLN